MKIFETFLELKMISDHFFQDITIYLTTLKNDYLHSLWDLSPTR